MNQIKWVLPTVSVILVISYIIFVNQSHKSPVTNTKHTVNEMQRKPMIEGTIEAEGKILDEPADSTLETANRESLVTPSAGSLKKRGLRITSLTAREGQNFFSIEVHCRDFKNWGCDMRNSQFLGYIEVNPPVNYQVVGGSESFTLIGPFKAGTAYEIKIKKGLASKKYSLADDYQGRIRTQNFKKSVRFHLNARYVPKSSDIDLNFEARNVTSFNLEVRKIPVQNIVYWLTGYERSVDQRISSPVFRKTVKVNGEANKRFKGKISLTEIATLGKGVYSLTATTKKNGYEQHLDQSEIVITDLAVVAKKAKASVNVWTSQIIGLKNLGGVKVNAYSYSNESLGECQTDSAGHCQINYPEDQKPYALIVQTAGDGTYLRFADLGAHDESVHAGKRAYVEESKPVDVFIYPSRGVYRPGETVNVAAIARQIDYQPVKDLPLTWIIENPRGKTIKEIVQKTSENGLMNLNFPTGAQTPTGSYQFIVKSKNILASRRILIEEFVPERIGMKISSDKKQYSGSEKPNFSVDAKYLFGPPVAGGQYKFQCQLTPAFSRIPGRNDFQTGLLEIKGPMKQISLDLQEGSLDDKGLASAVCDYSDLVDSFPTVMKVSGRFDVNESGSGRVSSKSFEVLAAPKGSIVGLSLKEQSAAKVAVAGGLFTIDGSELKEDAELEVDIERLEQNWIYSFDPDYHYYRWQSTDIRIPEGKRKVKVKGGKFRVEFSPSRSYGYYLVSVTDPRTGYKTEVKSYIGYSWYWAGPDSSGLAKPTKPERLKLRVNKEDVRAGDALKTQFEAPFAGRALVSMETDRLHESKWLDVRKGSNEFELVIPEVSPNVYVTALLVKQPKEGEFYVPARAAGALSVKINLSARESKPVIDTKDKVRPNQDFVVKVKSEPNSELTIAVVDEGILQLTGFKTPNPIDHFFEPRRLGVGTFETLGWTLASLMKKPLAGGGMMKMEAADAAGSGRVMPTRLISFWSGILKTNSRGEVSYRFKMPPFQGKVRVMVTTSSGSKTGSAEKFVTVADPLVVQPSFPRFLSQGDEFELPIFLVNTTGEAQTIVTKLETSGASVELPQKSEEIKLGDNESRTLVFRGKVKSSFGRLKFHVEATGGAYRSFDEQEIPITPFTPVAEEMMLVEANSEINPAELVSQKFLGEGLSFETGVSSAAYLKEIGQLGNLVNYPYGCLEQTTSSTFPLLVMGDLLPFTASKSDRSDEIPEMVASGISRVLSMQTPDGGFAYWPGGHESHKWGSVYAIHMLLTAKEFGYSVPESGMSAATNFIEKLADVRHRSDSQYYRDWEPYGLYVLSLLGKHRINRLQEMVSAKRNWGPDKQESIFLMMAALKNGGERTLAEKLMRNIELLKVASFDARDSHRTFYSPLRVDSLRLALAEKLWPAHEQQDGLARKVAARLRKSNRLNTQELAWSLIGLGRRAKALRKASVKEVKLSVNGTARAPSSVYQDNPIWAFATVNQSARLKYSYLMTGQRQPKAYLKFRGYLSKTPKNHQASLSLSRSYLNLDGQEIDLKKVRLGQLVVVEVELKNARNQVVENVALVDRLPAGFEIENPRLGRSRAINWINPKDQFQPEYSDIRDGEIRVFGKVEPSRTKLSRFYYLVRAVTAGEFTIPPAKIESMYEPELLFYSKTEKAGIKNL